MKQQIIESIIQQMLQHLDNVQLQRLKSVLEHELFDCEIKTKTKIVKNSTYENYFS